MYKLSSAAFDARYCKASYNFAFSLDSKAVIPVILNNPLSAIFLIVRYQPYLSFNLCEAAVDSVLPVEA
jgi:hypothetical protein